MLNFHLHKVKSKMQGLIFLAKGRKWEFLALIQNNLALKKDIKTVG